MSGDRQELGALLLEITQNADDLQRAVMQQGDRMMEDIRLRDSFYQSAEAAVDDLAATVDKLPGGDSEAAAGYQVFVAELAQLYEATFALKDQKEMTASACKKMYQRAIAVGGLVAACYLYKEVVAEVPVVLRGLRQPVRTAEVYCQAVAAHLRHAQDWVLGLEDSLAARREKMHVLADAVSRLQISTRNTKTCLDEIARERRLVKHLSAELCDLCHPQPRQDRPPK